jgi:hypothetical protein
MQKRNLAAFALALVGIAGSAGAQTVIQSANITADTTWGDNETVVILQQPIFVKNHATLTILPGVIVRGQPRSQPVVTGVTAGTPGTLIVTQAGKLNASGTPTNPIIFTTAAVDNNHDHIADDVDAPIGFEDDWSPGPDLIPGTADDDAFLDDTPKTAPLAPLNGAGFANVGLWGGVVILGRAPTNLGNFCGLGFGRCTIEGLTVPGFPVADVTYGGVEPHDSSGVIQYVSVRHAGDEIGASNELNGFSLGGVGDGTVFEFNEVYANFDDGFEWFGGTVNGNNLVSEYNGDDSFDQDQGYTGVNQFLFDAHSFFNETGGTAWGTDSGDKICELDGDDFNEPSVNVNLVGPESLVVPGNRAPWPLSAAIELNLTGIGSTADNGNPGTAVNFAPTNSANLGCQMRNGFAGQLRNSIVINTGTQAAFQVASGGAPGYTTPNNVSALADYNGDGLGDLVRSYCNTFNDGAALNADSLLANSNGDGLFAVATDNNTTAFVKLTVEDQTFNPQGVGGKLTPALLTVNPPLNPRPKAGIAGVGGCAGPTEPGTDGSAIYRGAFIRTAPTLWTTGWTVLNKAGLLAN